MMVAWDTGVRLGELLGLTWHCINTKKLTITVEQSVKRSRAKGVYLSPQLKSKYAYRVLPITKTTALALARFASYLCQHSRRDGRTPEKDAIIAWPRHLCLYNESLHPQN